MTTRVAESTIDAVRLYRRGATVMREIELDLSPDMLPLELEVPGLPLALSDTTVRLRVVDRDDALVVSDVHVGLHARPRNEFVDVPALETLRELERQIEWIEAQLEALASERRVLDALDVPARPDGPDGEPPPPSPLGARLALERFVDDAIAARIERGRQLRLELEDVVEERDKLRERLERIDAIQRVAASEVTKTVSATVRGTVAGTERLRLALEYFVDGARWAPAYQCRIAASGERAEVQLRALICQRTGEDWSGVRLELSTASAIQFTELPELTSLRIGRAQAAPPASPGFRPPPRGAAALFGDYDRGRHLADARTGRGAQPQLAPELVAYADSLTARVAHMRRADALERTELFAPMTGATPHGAVGAASVEWDEQEARKEREVDAMSLEVADASAWASDEDDGVASARLAAPRPAPRMAAAPAVPSPGAPPPPPPQTGASRKRYRGRSEAFGGVPSDAGIAVDAVPSFADLRLPAPSQTGERGRLVSVDRRAAYERSLKRSGLSLDGFDALSVVAAAQQLAARASAAGLPAGASDVSSVGVFDYAYRADARVDVPSDGMFHSVAVSQREGDCHVEYVVVPRLDTNVFRVATITNPLRSPLLPGAAELYVGGEYILTTQLPQVAPREHFRLGLGVEQAIKCARNTRYREARSGKAVVATAELWHTIEIELHNTLGRSASIEVRERIPQPEAGAEVVVEEGQVEPPWSVWTQDERGPVLVGGRRWQVELDPDQQQTLRAEYVVKIYAQNEIVGGNRREA